MTSKKILNIVFYKYYGTESSEKKACVFYSDGTVQRIGFDDAIDICEELCREYQIQTKDAFKEMINKNIVHVMSGKNFEERFASFLPKEPVVETMPSSKNEEAAKQMTKKKESAVPQAEKSAQDTMERRSSEPTIIVSSDGSGDPFADEDLESHVQDSLSTPKVDENPSPRDEKSYDEEEQSEISDEDFVEPTRDNIPEVEDTVFDASVDRKSEISKATTASVVGVGAAAIGKGLSDRRNSQEQQEPSTDEEIESDIPKATPVSKKEEQRESSNETSDDFDEEIEDTDFISKKKGKSPKKAPKSGDVGKAAATGIVAEEVAKDVAEAASSEKSDEESEKKKGFFKRVKDRIKNMKLVKRILICTTALATGLGLYGCAAKQSLEGEMYRSNIPSQETNIDKDDFYTAGFVFHRYNNDKYDEYGYNQLLEVTHNNFQKQAMINIRDGIVGFNDMFARNYVENGVRASLKWDEMVALQTAYNDYKKTEIKAYFNGAEIRSEDLSRAYKDATLQLMGAHAIETREHPVDMSVLIESEQGKEFYEKYHELFLQCKEATGDEKVEKVRQFYNMVRSDFPITHEIRTEGISHAHNYDMLESYMLSVVPMISASEMMFQNLSEDVTLNDEEVDFFNDLGLCNRADKVFERIETVTMVNEEDNQNPLYEQFRYAMIELLRKNNIYYVDDETRELTKLTAFQEAVNWHFDVVDEEEPVDANVTVTTNGSGEKVTTKTEQKVTTKTQTKTTYREETTRVNKPITPEAKKQVDAAIDAENQRAKEEAERLAEQERQRLQAEADRQAAQVYEEVKRDEQDLQNDIASANQQINQNNQDQNPANNTPVNESDFGDHGVKFDPAHQDGNGNLNDSVQNITTDPTGDKTNDPLPDPNVTGSSFDSQAPTTTAETQTYSQSAPTDQSTSSVAPTVQNNQIDDTTTQQPTVTQQGDGWVESVPVADDYYFEDAWVEEGDTTGALNAGAVDAYVESLANQDNANETGYQYVLE